MLEKGSSKKPKILVYCRNNTVMNNSSTDSKVKIQMTIMVILICIRSNYDIR